MKIIKLKKILLTLSVFLTSVFFASIPVAVSAGSLWDSQIGSKGSNSMGSWFGSPDKPDDLRDTIYKMINFSLNLLGVIFLVLLIVAGFLWMTSAGDTKKVETALGYIKGAIVGLVIILISKGLTIFIFQNLIDVISGKQTPHF